MRQHGFILEKEERVAELASTARLWRHEKSGAQLLSFINSDENKVFGVSFRTPPPDSTGVAHILEHSVLCGSEKYPVKEPFVELLKGSLQTFLNAFTYPDKTCYPVASANLQDFYNLTDVYLDAVFFPRITENIFRQEGWHLEKEDEAFIFKGVVYNEMKGAFSSPESVLARHSLRALFPDTVYALESGGDPKDIPSLSYQAFCDFHARYYHPANGRFFFWGDDPEEARLARLNAVLGRFEAARPDSAISLQKPLPEPLCIEVPYAAAEGEDSCLVTLNWLCADVMDIEAVLAFKMLDHILLGMPASPLRRALIESGLGEDLAGQGLENELRQLTFDAGLKGVARQNVDKAAELVADTLRRIAQQGISPEMAEAAVNSVEFMLRENNSGRFPVGLSVMLRSLTTWLYDGDPLAPLRFEAPLAAIKASLARGERYFEKLIERWLIDNPHCVRVVLTPDQGLEQRQEEEERRRVAAMTGAMDEAGQREMIRQAEALRAWQAEADSPEALAAIPRVGPEDLPAENALIPSERLEPQTPPVLFHPLPTNGIVYAEATFDLSAVPEYLLPLLPLFGRALLEMGTRRKDLAELNMAVARKTGGIDVDTLFLTHSPDRAPVARLSLSGKAAPDKVRDLFELMGEILAEVRLDDAERFLRMTLEEKARQEHGLVPAGHLVVAARLRSSLSGAGFLAERTGGVSALDYVRALAGRVEKDWPGVLQDLELLRRLIIQRAGLAMNLTATEAQRGELQNLAAALAARLPEQSVDGASSWVNAAHDSPQAEALLLPAQVNYVGKGVNLFDHGYAWHGSAMVILKYLRTGYLWDKVRVQGGAYGCICSLDRMSGALVMVSYRDPNVLPTLKVFDRAAGHLAAHAPGREELDAAIVGAIGELDAYMLPDAKGATAFARSLCGDTEELRARLREEILSTTAEHFLSFGQALEALTPQGRICALGGAAVERAAKDQGWAVEKIL